MLPLSQAPFNFTHAAVGRSAWSARWARWRRCAPGIWRIAGWGRRPAACLLLLTLAWLPLGLLGSGLVWLVAGIVLLDLAGQAIHVLNQSMIFSAHPQSHSRLVGCYMLFTPSAAGWAPLPAPICMPGWGGAASAGWGGRQPERAAVLAADAVRDAGCRG